MLVAFIALAPTSFGLTQASYWSTHTANGQHILFPGDVDGDGRADLPNIWPDNEVSIDVVLTSKWGKPKGSVRSRNGFGRDAVAAVCGAFAEGPGAAFVAVCADGSVHVASGMKPGENQFPNDDLATTIPAELRITQRGRGLVADFDADGKPDILVVGNDGRLVLLRNTRAAKGKPSFKAEAVALKIPGFRQVSAGNTTAGKPALVYWLDGTGALMSAPLSGAAKKLLQASPDDGLAVGRFRGAAGADVLVGQKLLVAGNPAEILPQPMMPKSAKGDLPWLVADFDGNGKDDVFRMRNTDEPFVGEDRFIHFSYDAKDPMKGYLCSAPDGLPDCWKTGQIKAGGLDLKALGCKVGRCDLVLDVQTFDDVSSAELTSEFEGVKKYFANLPIQNPDGSTGIAVHTIVHPSLPASQKNAVSSDFDRDRPPVEHRGITHWVQVFRGIGGVASIWGCRAQVNETWGCVVHELGHNFGLIHDGYQSFRFSPIYGSVMSYSYSYGIDDSYEKLTYSNGLFVGHDLDERHLSEVLPFPMEKVHFLSGRPYHYHLKPGPDGKTTLIDWNWNGIYGETDVAADINWEAGRQTWDNVDLSRTNCTPALVATDDTDKAHLLIVAAKHDNDAEPLSEKAPGKLFARMWIGDDIDRDANRWGGEQSLGVADCTGDPSVARLGDKFVVAYPTAKGVVLRNLSVANDGTVKAGEASPVPRTMGATPTLVAHNGTLWMLLWSGPNSPVTIGKVLVEGASPFARPPVATRIVSQYPVGATSGTGVLWISGVERTKDGHNKWRLYSLRGETDNFSLRTGEYCAGEGAGRVQVLVEPAKGFDSTGQAYLFARGGGDTFGDIWEGFRSAEEGWRQIKYDFGGPVSRTAPGVCALHGDWAMAMYRQDGTLYCTFRGRGIRAEPVKDFDDIGHIARVGLQQSISTIEAP